MNLNLNFTSTFILLTTLNNSKHFLVALQQGARSQEKEQGVKKKETKNQRCKLLTFVTVRTQPAFFS